jgi:flavin reductase (DIM6/NTAB) family NADH-FMN oxidoreductase RutF
MQADERQKPLKRMSDAEWMLEQLWAPIVAVTAAHEGRANALISSTAVSASLLPETPRVAVQLARASLTRELALASGTFAVHFLPADERGLELFRALGFRSGRDASKLDGVSTKPGTLGAPILGDAVTYVEARVARTLDTEDMTVVVADVVGGAQLRTVPVLTIEFVRERLPAEWLAEWEVRRERELEDARRFRR